MITNRASRGVVIHDSSSRYFNCTPPGRALQYTAFLFILVLSSLLPQFAPVPYAHAYTESERNVKLDAPFVPTPNYVISEILSKARVGKDDILYDLGSGDGRIVIEAARQTGCRAVGIEIDPDLVEDSLRAAERAGGQDRVRFIVADIFTADFREATVVTIYMGGHVNLKLRPRLLRELKPGTRVASYCFDMGDWKPDAVSTFGKEDAYFWIIPANASGTWQWTEGKGKTSTSWQLEIKQVFQEISGFVTCMDKQYPLRDGKVTGEGIRFALDGEAFGKASPVVFSGRIQGNEIEGTIGGKGSAHLTWRATRHTDAPQDIAR
ncbi:MAG: class I SAM-dependent methyltransferase [Deltaproteobacteria bacterium]|nr:class I SAM-dependent methyltransferase [Deltaproteobacteria bacterium]